MKRLLVVTHHPEGAKLVGQHLEACGAVVVGLPGPVVTAIVPTLGPITVTTVVGDERFERLQSYTHDAIAVAILAATGEASFHRDLEPVINASRRLFPHQPVAVGVSGAVTDSMIGWVAGALQRSARQVPVFQVDPAVAADVLTLFATALCLAGEAGHGR